MKLSSCSGSTACKTMKMHTVWSICTPPVPIYPSSRWSRRAPTCTQGTTRKAAVTTTVKTVKKQPAFSAFSSNSKVITIIPPATSNSPRSTFNCHPSSQCSKTTSRKISRSARCKKSPPFSSHLHSNAWTRLIIIISIKMTNTAVKMTKWAYAVKTVYFSNPRLPHWPRIWLMLKIVAPS